MVMKETELRDYLEQQFQNIVKAPYLLGSEVPIPYKHIYIPSELMTKLEIWCFKQDIIIYQNLYDKTIGYKDARITYNKKEHIEIVLEKDSHQKSHHVGLPYVILELKVGQPDSHQIITYSQKAQMIKTIFPYCQFLFLVHPKKKIAARTYRHGLNFDEIITLKNPRDKAEINALRKCLVKHFKIALASLSKLKKESIATTIE